jgi:perosamine synthetase
MQTMLDRGISTRRGIMNAHQEAAYRRPQAWDLPHSEAARDGVILLPLHHSLTDGEQAYIIEQLRTLAR